MHRIDTSDPRQRWRFVCPSPERHHNWRVTDGHFECRQCGVTYEALIDARTGDRVHRDEIEFVGAKADHEGEFGKPTVE